MKRVTIVGTADTKGEELAYFRDTLLEAGRFGARCFRHDPEADAALFDTLEDVFEPTAERRLIRLPHHINDPAVSAALAENFAKS